MTLPIYQLLYVSEHHLPVAGGGYSKAIYEIGLEATTRNQQLDVTGFLICAPCWFAQVLEGRKAAIEDLMERIQRDPRHDSLRTLMTRHNAVRLFPNWSMGISTLGPSDRRLFEQHGVALEAAPDDGIADTLIQLARDLAKVRAGSRL